MIIEKDGIIVIYKNDFIIPSEIDAEGMYKLKLVLQITADYGLELNLKTSFLISEIEFFGCRMINGSLCTSANRNQSCLAFSRT